MNSAMNSTKATKTVPATDASNYKKLTQREHILQLPDTYIGSRDSHKESRWIYDTATNQMVWRTIDFNPGFYKIFDEVVVNAIDHVTRTATKAVGNGKVTKLRVTITPTSFSVWNDGEGIPVVVHPEYKVMIPELIFGHLLTSSNYDETEEKVVGGKNGYGAKLTNIYSKTFTLRTADAGAKMIYEQVFSDNMATIGKPAFKKLGATAPYTEITSVPDLARFFGPGAEAIPADMLDVLRTRVIDAAALVAAAGVTVTLDDKPVPVKSFESYVRLFLGGGKVPVFYERAGPRWEVAAVLTRHLHTDAMGGIPDDRHISFVNGIFTRRGGKHVDSVTRAVLGAFCDGPGKKLDLKPAQLKDAVTFFVNATIVNPSFDSQTKETLTTPAAKFGSVFKISEAFVLRLAKDGGLLDEAQAVLDARLSRDAKKSDGRKTASVRGIPKAEDAIQAGKARSAECTLILTEGDSAASTAISGLAVVGRDLYGVFPLKGKILNVKEATIKQKTNNEEITRIKLLLGLEHGKKYKDLRSLRYGRVMVMTDQDVDGSHIKGLLINLFHTEWPELLQLGFVCCLMTPLLKAVKGTQTHCFYSQSEYEKWLSDPSSSGGKGWHVKYYKGLGTSTAAEARDYFTTMNTVRFTWDATSDDHIDLAFNADRTDDRKDWLTTYDRERHIDVPAGGADITYTSFINDELIHFSNADNLRSLPHVMDGLKPSQRKVLWAARKRGLTVEIKVAQLAGYVSETAAYHHGEKSLNDTIVNMAQDYVGASNINLMAPNGQFGTRLQGGKDAASPRYIFTALDPIQATILNKADDPALTWLEDDGQQVEPEFYIPVLPLLLVNGCKGIGTGYSTMVPCYSPKDLVASLRSRLRGDVADLTDTRLVPWYDGFRGPVSLTPDGTTMKTAGIYQFLPETLQVRITELPVGLWTKDYKVFLEEMLKEEAPPIKGFQEAYNDVDVEFTIQLDADTFGEAQAFPAKFEKTFKLVKSEKLSNLVAFDLDGMIRRFAGPGEILETFYMARIGGYVARKANELARLDTEIVEKDARVRFVRAVITKTLVITNASDEDLLVALKAHDLPPLSSESSDLRAYEYLLRMRVDRLKASAVVELESELAALRAEKAALESKTPEDLWLTDLDVFSVAYESFHTARVDRRTAVGKGTPVKAKKAASKATATKRPKPVGAAGSAMTLVS
jgi:DNA topoisomerase-2